MRRAVPYILTFVLLLAPFSAAGINLSGSMGWRFADYQADGGGAGAADARSFSQQYKLQYGDAGNLNGGRGGSYTYSLGAEFTAINNTINGTDDALSTFKPLYAGQLLLAPGGLPFRFKLYCGDTHATSLVTSGATDLVDTGIAYDFVNGKHRVTGATLAIGIKNGTYLGGYRETLSKWPRVLMDYREIEVESFRSKLKQNYRQRELAFVSLNKKDNWFHYRFTDYKDFLRPDGTNDYLRKSYILGTIDPVLDRAWINLTNWIKLSADGTFTQTKMATMDITPVEAYTTNLFLVMKREGIRTTILPSFFRERDDKNLQRSLTVPVSINKRVDRDTSWQFNAFLGRSHNEDTIALTNDENLALGLRVNNRQSRPLTLSTLAKVDVFDQITGIGSAQEAGIELTRNSLRSQVQHTNFLGVHLRRFSGEGLSGRSVDYLEQELSLRHARYHKSWRVSADEQLLFGQGTITGGFGNSIVAKTAYGQRYSNNQSTSLRDGSTIHSITSLSADIGIGRDLSNRFSLLLDYLNSAARDNLQAGLSHSLTAQISRKMRYTMTNELVVGEGQTASNGAIADGELSVSAQGATNRTFAHSSELLYMVNRSFDGGFKFRAKSLDGTKSLHYLGQQNCRYTFFRVNGIIRPLVFLEEELAYESVAGGLIDNSDTKLSLSVSYFPTRHLTLSAYSRYMKYVRGSVEGDSLLTTLSAGWSYSKLTLRLLYSQGVSTTEREEQSFKVQLDKTF